MVEDRHDLRLAARDLLRQHGATSPAELAEQLRGMGHDPGDAATLRSLLLEEVDDADEANAFTAFPVTHGRLVDLDHLLDGLVLTHVLTAQDVGDQTLPLADDLSAAELASRDGRTVPLADGRHLELVGDQLAGPDGWLPDRTAVVVTVTADGLVVAGADEVPGVDLDVAEQLRETWEELVALGADDDLTTLLVEARVRHPQLLATPQAPVRQLLAAVGLAVDDLGWIGDVEEAAGTALAAHLTDDHGLTEATVVDVFLVDVAVKEVSNRLLGELQSELLDAVERDLDEAEVVEVLERTADRDRITDLVAQQGEDPELVAALSTVLTDHDATRAFLHDMIGTDVLDATVALALLDTTRVQLSRRDRANRHWLRARLVEFVADDHTEAERELVRARGLDGGHPGMLFDLAGYKEDRGDAGAALALLQRVTGVDPDRVAMLEHFARPGPMTAGRNDPCPCGSGRKHKACCALSNGWSPADRAVWVREKLVRHLDRPSTAVVVRDVFETAAAHDLLDSDDAAVLLLCLSLFDAGVAAHFADVRGALLPADELEMVRSLAEVRAAAYEVTATSGTAGIELIDLRSERQIQLTDRSLRRDVTVGLHLLAWVADDNGRPVAQFGAVRIPPAAVSSLLETLDDDAGAGDLVRWFAHAHRAEGLETD